jgi:serine/threonine-protein kinase RsbW
MITLRNELTELSRLAQAVEAFGKAGGLSDGDVYAANLVLEEIVTNVIRYGYGDGGEHEIRIRADLDGDEMHLEVEDDGRPFNPLGAKAPDIDLPLAERPIGGLGIFLVRKLMDQVVYRREGDLNVLTMRKRLTRSV